MSGKFQATPLSFPSSSSASPASVLLTPDLSSSFQVGRFFSDNSARINAIDFRSAGDFLVTSADDQTIHLYNIETGTAKKEILSKRYGAALIRFTHHSNAVLFASGNSSQDFSLRYLSLHDNRFLRFFKGHKAPVVSLNMSPIDDSFLSAGLDRTVRLWDLRTNNCQGICKISPSAQEMPGPTRPAVSYDPQGLIFAISGHSNTIQLYDKRSSDKGPFSTFLLPSDDSSAQQWGGLKFSPDGKYMLLATTAGRLFLVDAFNGDLKREYEGIVNRSQLALEACFSPDAQFVLSGSEDGSVHLYETHTGEERVVWENAHEGAVQAVAWCPDRLCFATASNKLALWAAHRKEQEKE